MLAPISEYNDFKKEFRIKFQNRFYENRHFREFMYEIFFEDTAYVVGGFLRDIANKKISRDLDMIVTLNSQKLHELVKRSSLEYRINRMNGVKIILSDFEIDIWSIDDNWAFKNALVKRNDEYILENISNGCFYNFDSLVINVHTLDLYARNYNECVKNTALDILQKRTIYKNANPTVEANILRAFYIKEEFNISFSYNCLNYLVTKLKHLNDQNHSALEALLRVKEKYVKYSNVLSEDKVAKNIQTCLDSILENKSQVKLNL